MRQIQNIARIQQFGGMDQVSPQRAMSISNCVDCLNVHTANGAIEKRPGYGLIVAGGDNTGSVLKTVYLNDTAYLFAARVHRGGASRSWGLYGFSGVLYASETTDAAMAHARRPSVQVFNNRLYIAMGRSDFHRKVYKDVEGIWRTERVGIIAPTTAPTVVPWAPAGTIPQGNVSYRYTYYNIKADVESGPSPEGRFTGGHEGRFRVDWLATDDDQVQHVKLYLKHEEHDSDWFLIFRGTREQADLSYIDMWGAQEKEPAFKLNTVVDLPPNSGHIAVYKSSMWWAYDYATNVVRYSELDEPERVNPLKAHACGRDDEAVTGMVEAFGRLLIFKEHSIWYISGGSERAWIPQRLTPSVGCVSEHTIRIINGVLYFLDQTGLYKMTAGGVIPVGRRINIASLIDPSTWDAMSAAHDPVRNLYILTAANIDGTSGWGLLVYDYVRDNWFRWDLPLWSIETYRDGEKTALVGTIDRFHGPEQLGDIVHLRGTSDRGQPIDWSWQMSNSDFGTTRHKKFYYFNAAIEAASGNPSVEVSIDENSLGVVQKNQPTAKVERVARTAQFKLGSSTDYAMAVTAVEIDAEPVGHR